MDCRWQPQVLIKLDLVVSFMCVMDCFMFYHRKNMCKAEGAEFYITAADRHWKTDGELRAVAEVPF